MSSSGERSRNDLSDSPPDWIAALTKESRHRVHVCYGKNCTPNGAESVFRAFQTAIRDGDLEAEIELMATSCRSRCELGPSVNVYPGPVTYGLMDDERAREVVRRHLIAGGQPIEEYVVTQEDVERAKSSG